MRPDEARGRLVEAGQAIGEEVARMEHELESLGREFRLIEESHGKNVLHLVLVVG